MLSATRPIEDHGGYARKRRPLHDKPDERRGDDDRAQAHGVEEVRRPASPSSCRRRTATRARASRRRGDRERERVCTREGGHGAAPRSAARAPAVRRSAASRRDASPARGRARIAASSQRSPRQSAIAAKSMATDQRNGSCPSSGPSTSIGFARSSAVHQAPRSSGNAHHCVAMTPTRADHQPERDDPVAEDRAEAAPPRTTG